jgi:hypothetical protein
VIAVLFVDDQQIPEPVITVKKSDQATIEVI